MSSFHLIIKVLKILKLSTGEAMPEATDEINERLEENTSFIVFMIVWVARLSPPPCPK